MEIIDNTYKSFIETYEGIIFDKQYIKMMCSIFGALLFIDVLVVFNNIIENSNGRGADGSIVVVLMLGPLVLILLFLLLKIKKSYVKKLGMDESKAKRQYDFLKNDIWQLPLIQQICLLNALAKSSQIELLKMWYGVESSVLQIYVYDKIYSEENVEEEIEILNSKELPVRQDLVQKLFKLAVAEDGIHNDEWNLLMEMMTKFKLNKNYIAYFKKRYGPLRTEFDEDEKTSSTNSNSVATNNPYYAILGLNDGATDDEIKRAYHNLALQHHPDLPKNADRKDECDAMMAKINEAYEKVRG